MSRFAATQSAISSPLCPVWSGCRCWPPSCIGSIASATSEPKSHGGLLRHSTCSESVLPRRASTRSIPVISTRSGMRRRGSPFTGVGVVLAKEAADYLSGARMWLLEALVFLTALAAVYATILSIRASIGESPFLFLRLLTMAQDPLPSFIALLGFLIPLVAIAIGFDAINGEFSRRTLSRVLAQPIYRDALLLGKFLAGLLSLTIALLSLWLLVFGLGLLLLGLPPGGEEMVRMLGFLAATIAYGAVWLALALLFSVLFRAPATASRRTRFTAIARWPCCTRQRGRSGRFWSPWARRAACSPRRCR